MKKIIKIIAIILILLSGGLLFLLTTHGGGVRGFIVQTGSMEPTITQGAFVLTQQTSPNTLQRGEIITFIRPDKTNEIITHRIYAIQQQGRTTIIKTKGDNNKSVDPWTVAGGGVIGKVQLSVSYLGYILAFIKTKLGILFFVLIPALYLIIEEIGNIVRLFSNKRERSKPAETPLVSLIFFFSLTTLTFSPTYAMLSDTAKLTGNHFILETDTITCVDESTVQNNIGENTSQKYSKSTIR